MSGKPPRYDGSQTRNYLQPSKSNCSNIEFNFFRKIIVGVLWFQGYLSEMLPLPRVPTTPTRHGVQCIRVPVVRSSSCRSMKKTVSTCFNFFILLLVYYSTPLGVWLSGPKETGRGNFTWGHCLPNHVDPNVRWLKKMMSVIPD